MYILFRFKYICVEFFLVQHPIRVLEIRIALSKTRRNVKCLSISVSIELYIKTQ